MLLADIHAFFQQQIKQNLLTDFSQVSRDNPVIIFGFSFKIRKILRNQLSGGAMTAPIFMESLIP